MNEEHDTRNGFREEIFSRGTAYNFNKSSVGRKKRDAGKGINLENKN